MTHKIWFTSDSHFGHKNILSYSGRPWDDIESMNKALIERWNNRVGPKDTVYHLGDFTLTNKIDLIDEWLGQLNGAIRLVKGNHDHWVKKIPRLKNAHKIKWVKDYAERNFTVDGVKRKIILCHFPMLFWNEGHNGSIMAHGHCHGHANHLNLKVRRVDVGADCFGWAPISLEELVNQVKNIEVNPHHAGRDTTKS